MNRTLANLLLVASPRHIPTTVRNLSLWLKLRRDPEAFKIWNEYFDEVEYRTRYPDVSEANVSPLLHFLLRGNTDLRDPSEKFDLAYYIDQYPDITTSGVNALVHFALFGHREGRISSEFAPTHKNEQVLSFVNNQWRRDYPLVSLVIPCFNYGQFIEQAVRSVLNQTFPDIELIVVEGGSTDACTVAEVRRLESLGLPKTQFYFRSERHLVGDNRNFGISRARGRYVVCLDADDFISPIYIEIAVFFAEVFGYDIVTASAQFVGAEDSRWLLTDPRFPEILERNQVTTSALFRRSAWVHVGGFRDWGLGTEYVCEDWDFWIRLLGHGYHAKSIRQPLYYYRSHEHGLTSGNALNLSNQRDLLKEANSEFYDTTRLSRNPRKSVLNPWANLGPAENAEPALLLALPFISIGGAETLFHTLAARAVERGQRLIVITTLQLPRSVPDDTTSFERLTSHVYPLARLFTSHQMRKTFISYLVKRYSVSTLLLAGSQLVYEMLPQLRTEFPELLIIDQLFNDSVHVPSNLLYSAAIDKTIVPSQQLLADLTEKHKVDPRAVEVIPHGIRIPDERPEDRNILPAAAAGKVVVAFFGRLSSEKAPDIFVEIARTLSSCGELFFVMTGEGPEREKTLALIRKYGLEDQFHAPGFVDNVEPLMRASDIIVLPSRIDGMPLAVLEAQALGKPVVASRVGSLPFMIEHESSGFLCEISDVPEFCRRILLLANDPRLRKEMGLSAQRNFQAAHSADQMLEAYEHVFQSGRKNHRR
jgi:O-antigen biosynthesis protein